ncbi:HpcH/HpaI aldolase/citrate lyase family protein [Vibrio splendidus]
MKAHSYFSLGASLYTPANHIGLARTLENGVGSTKSLVVCTEDAVSEEELPSALVSLEKALLVAPVSVKFVRYLRPRNAEVLAQVLRMPNIERFDGFVLPKCDLDTLPEYLSLIEASGLPFQIMPTIESIAMTSKENLNWMREILDKSALTVTCIRIGGNDLLSECGMKRTPGVSIYDTPIKQLIDSILLAFRPFGYEISAPVFDVINDVTTLKLELQHDLAYGFWAKTAIHPSQVQVIEDSYRQYVEENAVNANSLLLSKDAVYQVSGQMMEITCHSNWAHRVLNLAQSVNNW